MLARFATRREGRIALALAAAFSLSACGGMSKMQEILTDKPANKEQQPPSTPKQTSGEPQAPEPMTLPPAQ